MARAIMIQGAGSNVGKSLIVAGLCRAARARGVNVCPFKPQNMSNNAAVTLDGGEIGRAQALQARASGLDPRVDMNPVLLKPETETGAQVIVQGKRLTTVKAREYAALKPTLLEAVTHSFEQLSNAHDLIIVEGAGSPAEINLRAGDIANMGFAEAVDIPVILVGDIDRGGVIAQIVGTHAVLPVADRDRIVGFIINKFRGDPSLFDEGYHAIEARTGWPGFGVAPWFADAGKLPAEDVIDIRTGLAPDNEAARLHIVVPQIARIANFDDLDPLAQEPNLRLSIIPPGQALPGDANLIILPGTKSTVGDLAFLRAQGWDIDLRAHVRRGGHVLGICGGYQMLGQRIDDPEGVEGPAGTTEGLGLLDVETVMSADKRTVPIRALHAESGTKVQGYEIHIGQTDGPDRKRGWLEMQGQKEGAASPDGRIKGTYVHGLFADDRFRAAFLGKLGVPASGTTYDASVDGVLDDLARHLETHLGIEALLAAAR